MDYKAILELPIDGPVDGCGGKSEATFGSKNFGGRPIFAKQEDFNSRFFLVTLMDDRKKIPYSDYGTVTKVGIGVARGDGQSKAFLGIDNGDGTFTLPLDAWAVEIADDFILCDAMVWGVKEDGSNYLIRSANFRVYVQSSGARYTDIMDGKTYDLLSKLLQDLSEFEKKAGEEEENRTAAEKRREEAESGRVSAEEARAEAEGKRNAAETSRDLAEQERDAAENEREKAEDERAAAEQTRESAESGREEAEQARVAEEEARAAAESERESAEGVRNTVETERETAENARASAEDKRAEAESGREEAENERVTEEALRAAAEESRSKAEEKRAAAETEREKTEAKRATAEGTRAQNEVERAQAEKDRAKAETERVAEETLRSAAETERSKAEEKRSAAELQRAAAEGTRAGAEDERAKAEKERASAESERAFAEGKREAAETSRASAEDKRAEADEERGTAEQTRVAAELLRDTAEKARAENEKLRATAENDRTTKETLRTVAEENRSKAEEKRSDAETEREKAEAKRGTAEETRAQNEAERAQGEKDRAKAETERAVAEGTRATAEAARASAEKERDEAEKKRSTAETKREDAEEVRAKAETERDEEEGKRASAEAVRAESEAARVRAEEERAAAEKERAANMPHIGENGNWFIGERDTGVRAQGENGTDGKDGVDGTDGKDGADGATWLSDFGEPTDETGKEGDHYLDTETGDVYNKKESGWGDPIFNMMGKRPTSKIYGVSGMGSVNPVWKRTYDASGVELSLVPQDGNENLIDFVLSDPAMQDFFHFQETTDEKGNVFVIIPPMAFRYDRIHDGEVEALSVKLYEDGDESLGYELHPAFKKWTSNSAYNGYGSVQIAKYMSSPYDTVSESEAEDDLSDRSPGEIKVRSVSGVNYALSYVNWEAGMEMIKATDPTYHMLHWMYKDLLVKLASIFFARADIYNMLELEDGQTQDCTTGTTDEITTHSGMNKTSGQLKLFGLDAAFAGTNINGIYWDKERNVYYTHLVDTDAATSGGYKKSSLSVPESYSEGYAGSITKISVDSTEKALAVPAANLQVPYEEDPGEARHHSQYYCSRYRNWSEPAERGQVWVFQKYVDDGGLFTSDGLFFSYWYSGFDDAWVDYGNNGGALRLCKMPS